MGQISSFITKEDKKSFENKFDNGRITIAEIMDTRNVSRTGEVMVWIPTSRIPKEDSSRWILARYASPFYGVTTSQQTYQQSYNQQQKSYGFFFTPPDVGNKVFIFFPNIQGSNTLAYWFACPVDPELSSMLPGIAYGSDKKPVIEKTVGVKPNTAEAEAVESSSIPFDPLWNAIQTQGLKDDFLRGASSSSIKRESPSRAYGILSPLGHQLVIDDGWSLNDSLNDWENGGVNKDTKSPTNELDVERYDSGIRLRTRDGVQILLSNNKGHIYMINKDGTAWAELNNDGYIDCWALKGISASTEGDINLNAKRNININCGGNVNLKVAGEYKIEANNMTTLIEQNYQLEAKNNIEEKAGKSKIVNAVENIQEKTEAIMLDTPMTSINGEIKVKTSIDVPTIKATTVSAGTVNAMINGDVNGSAKFATTAGSAPLGPATPFTNPQSAPTLKNPDTAILPQVIQPEVVKTIHTNLNNIIESINSRQPSSEPFYYHYYNDANEDVQIPLVQQTKEQIASTPEPYNVKQNTVSNNISSTMVNNLPKAIKQQSTILPPDLQPDMELVSLNKNDIYDTFEKSFQEVMLSEGGYVNDPKDPGGETKFGVSKRAYPNLDIYNLTIEQAREIYRNDYWNKCKCDDLPNGVSVMLSDFAYNSGSSRAIKCLQSCVGLDQTGVVDQTLINTIKSAPIDVLMDKYKKTRLNFLQGLSTWNRYGKGWTNRVNSNYDFALTV